MHKYGAYFYKNITMMKEYDKIKKYFGKINSRLYLKKSNNDKYKKTTTKKKERVIIVQVIKLLR